MSIPSNQTQQYMAHACACSPFAQRLILADEVLAQDCAKLLHLPFSRQAMQAFLAEQDMSDEVSLKKPCVCYANASCYAPSCAI